MNDFGTTLTALFDEVADTIEPRANFESVLHGKVREPASVVTRHRPPWHVARVGGGLGGTRGRRGGHG